MDFKTEMTDTATIDEIQLERARLRLAQLRFRDYVLTARPGYMMDRFHLETCRAIERLLAGEFDRLMIFAPPRHGKSELVSRLLPSYFLGANPDKRVITTSYSASLAMDMSRDVQRIMQSPEYQRIFPTIKLGGKDRVKTQEAFDLDGYRGGYKCAGVGGPITGKGMDLGIIDDPFKSREEAESEIYRDKTYKWYTDDFYSRQEGRCPIVVMHTRWHEDDLAGRLIEDQNKGGDEWHIVNFPAILETEPLCNEEWREKGDALWPGKFNRETLEKIKNVVIAEGGTRTWSSLYQQSPVPEGGNLFKKEWFRYCTFDVTNDWIWFDDFTESRWKGTRFTTVDLATSEKETADYTVISTWTIQGEKLILLDVDRRRMEGPDIIPAIQQNIQKWRVGSVWIEKAGFQLSLIQDARRKGIPVRELIPDKDKISRAIAATPVFEAGNVWFASEPWLHEVEHELTTFPAGKHDDIVDTVSYAAQVYKDIMLGCSGPMTIDTSREYDRMPSTDIFGGDKNNGWIGLG